ncbi:MAG: site-2 protease family protein [Gammaproteobacteria bacterium]|nr:MAG: site-2 protease family protein [Gammaproteobacteria bacterium]
MNTIQTITIWAIPVLFAITLHEVAHGWVAKKFGDTTAQSLGRLSLNPLKHIDPVGTILVPIVLIVVTGYAFGWAKPVPVNFNQLRNPKKDMVWVAAAGPFANVLMTMLWSIILVTAISSAGSENKYAEFFVLMSMAGIFINLVLMVLNLLPIPPLDGGRVLSGLVPNNISALLSKIEPYGLFILLGLMFMGLLNKLVFTPSILILFFIMSFLGILPQEYIPYLEKLLGQAS